MRTVFSTESLFELIPAWLRHDDGVLLAARVQVSRNLAGVRFPGRLPAAERRRLQVTLAPLLADLDLATDGLWFELAEVLAPERRVLRERRLVEGFADDDWGGRALLTGPDEGHSVMVNGEDHLALRFTGPADDLPHLVERAEQSARQLDPDNRFAKAPDLGFLTACPVIAGGGATLVVGLYLPALGLAGQMPAVARAVSRLGYALQPLLPETGNEDFLELLRLPPTRNPAADAAELPGFAQRLAIWERRMRQLLSEQQLPSLMDQVARAYGVLRHAQLLGVTEAVHLLSRLRLGVELGMFRTITRADVSDLLVACLPGHLAKRSHVEPETAALDLARAVLVRTRLERWDAKPAGGGT